MDPAGDDQVAALWAATLERLAERAAHEIRNPLNGALLSLAVVRSRAGRSGADMAALVAFSESAALELERATARIEALLALARGVPSRIDLSTLLSQLQELLAGAATRDGGSLHVEREVGGALEAAGDGAVVRLLMAAAMDGAVTGYDAVTCTLSERSGSALLTVRGGPSDALPVRVREAGAARGFGITDVDGGIEILFPGRMRGST